MYYEQPCYECPVCGDTILLSRFNLPSARDLDYRCSCDEEDEDEDEDEEGVLRPIEIPDKLEGEK